MWDKLGQAISVRNITLAATLVVLAVSAVTLTQRLPADQERAPLPTLGRVPDGPSARSGANAASTVAALATAFVSRPTSTPTLATTLALSTQSPLVESPVASPTVAQNLRQPPAGAPESILDEQFGDNHRGWPSDPNSTAWLASGAYHLLARQPTYFVAIGAPLHVSVGDVAVRGQFQKRGGPPGGGYGLIVRDEPPGPRDGINQEGHFVVLEAGDQGEFGVWRRAGNTWLDVIPWTHSDVVRVGRDPNDLMVKSRGTTLTFVINGVQVAQVVETTLTGGGVGVFVGGDYNEAVLSRFIIELPE